MAHYRASESKREQFRRYLEKAGVLDSLTKVLVALYEETEKPSNALESAVLLKPLNELIRVSRLEPGETSQCMLRLRLNPTPSQSFIKHQLGVGPEDDDAESLRLELTSLQQKYDQLMEENKELRNRLLRYEPAQDVGTE